TEAVERSASPASGRGLSWPEPDTRIASMNVTLRARSRRLPAKRVWLALVLSLVGVSSLAPVTVRDSAARYPAGLLSVEGTPIGGEPVVIEAIDAPSPATPAGDQILRLAGPRDDPESLDPALARDLSTAFLVRQVFQGLTRLDGQLNVVPALTDRIEVSADGRVYTFRLRADARFHDGSPITAGAVVASFTRALDPATANGNTERLAGPSTLIDIEGAAEVVAGLASELRGMRVLDGRTVEVRLVAPRATFLMRLAGAAAAIVDPADPKRGADWWRAPNGSGPFRIAAWEPDDLLILEAAGGYPANRPVLEKIEMRLGPRAGQAFNLFQAGEIDLTTVPASATERLIADEGSDAARLITTPQFATTYIAFRTDAAPLDDPHLRRALAIAFPRQKFADVALQGTVLAASGLIPPGMPRDEWPVTATPADLDQARQEIAASRYGSARAVPPIRIYGADTAGAEVLREVAEEELGLRVEVVAVEWPEFLNGLQQRIYPAYELYWGADYPDPESMLWSLFAADSPDNYSAYANGPFNALLQQAMAMPDPEQRAELYARAQQILLDDHAVIPLYHDVRYTVVKPAVKGLEITPLGIIDLAGVWLEH
ncbi:MAG: peptide ABC transporter substrate-binding protein, partial [Chloroflexota bacterium]|nr:peptide ABC transporter substrate-binding protein [Chloroflexota bacterium]